MINDLRPIDSDTLKIEHTKKLEAAGLIPTPRRQMTISGQPRRLPLPVRHQFIRRA